jgi:hypothetical protein
MAGGAAETAQVDNWTIGGWENGRHHPSNHALISEHEELPHGRQSEMLVGLAALSTACLVVIRSRVVDFDG